MANQISSLLSTMFWYAANEAKKEGKKFDYQIYLHKKGKFFFFKKSQVPDNIYIDTNSFETWDHAKLTGA